MSMDVINSNCFEINQPEFNNIIRVCDMLPISNHLSRPFHIIILFSSSFVSFSDFFSLVLWNLPISNSKRLKKTPMFYATNWHFKVWNNKMIEFCWFFFFVLDIKTHKSIQIGIIRQNVIHNNLFEVHKYFKRNERISIVVRMLAINDVVME